MSGPNHTGSSESSEPLVFDNSTPTNASFAVAEARRAKYNSFKFFKPPVVLALFVMMNFWTYYDRGCMATAISSIRTDPTIASPGHPVSQTDAGLLQSIFMVGFLVASPLFTGLGGVLSAKNIILLGLCVWCVSVVVTGIMHGFYGLLVTRAFVGVGEAAYVGYTVTMVDNMAPPALRTLWIGIFYAMIPVGTALGMTMGGVLSSDGNTANLSGWRLCFLTEVVPMLIVVCIFFFLPTEYNPLKDPRAAKSEEAEAADEDDDGVADGTATPAGPVGGEDLYGNSRNVNSGAVATRGSSSSARGAVAAADEFVPLPTAVMRLVRNLDYLCLVVGYGMYTFVLGAVSVWAVSMMTDGPLGVSKVAASVFLGGTTAITGLLGALLGGVAVDKLGGSTGLQGLYKCAAFNAVMITISLPLGLIAVMSSHFAMFAVFLVPAVFALFSITAPVNSAILTCVPKNLRTYAMTLSITIMHAIGDVPSPIIAGAISDSFNDGCSSFDHDEMACKMMRNATVGSKPCVWVAGSKEEHTESFCTNEYQLRNALAIIFAVIAIAIPAFLIPAIRNRHRYGTVEDPHDKEREALVNNQNLSLHRFRQHEQC